MAVGLRQATSYIASGAEMLLSAADTFRFRWYPCCTVCESQRESFGRVVIAAVGMAPSVMRECQRKPLLLVLAYYILAWSEKIVSFAQLAEATA